MNTTLRTVAQAIAERVEFDCNGTFTGHVGERSRYVGQLPAEFHADYVKAGAAQDFYMVRSYLTPIAWFANGEWTIPAVKYSVTTSRHQGKLYLVK